MQTKEEVLLNVRAGLGRWKRGSQWVLIKEKDTYGLDPYPYEIQEFKESYKPIRKQGASLHSVLNMIKQLRQIQYSLVEPFFPELQVHFRNGEPITGATLVEDFLNGITSESPQSNENNEFNFNALLDAF